MVGGGSRWWWVVVVGVMVGGGVNGPKRKSKIKINQIEIGRGRRDEIFGFTFVSNGIPGCIENI